MGGGSSRPIPYVTTTVTVYQVTQVPMPLAGNIRLTASIFSGNDSLTTYTVSDCAAGNSCIFTKPLTFTAGPSTYHFEGGGYWNILGHLDCKYKSETKSAPMTAACDWTLGQYPATQLKNLKSSWITTPATRSQTITAAFTRQTSGAQGAFVDVSVSQSEYVTSYKEGSVPYIPYYDNAGSSTQPNLEWLALAAGLSMFLTVV